jgi:hypothetical protein
MLHNKKNIPKCMRSGCNNNQVNFNGRCGSLEEQGPCPKHTVLRVNATTLQLACAVNFDLPSRFEEEESDNFYAAFPSDDIGAFCLPAGKRSQEEKCQTQA